MKFITMLFVFLLGVSGCATMSPGLYQYHHVESEANNQHMKIYPLYVDKSFDKNELETLVKVVNEWNYVLNGYMRFEIDQRFIDHEDTDALKKLAAKINETHEGILIVGVDHDSPLVSDVVEEGDGVLAFVDGLGDRAHFMAVLRDRIGHRNLHKILLHEFGHAMGGRHVEALSLMYPYVGYQQMDCVDKITAAQVANHYKLDLTHMNYCSTPNFE